jgi:hypothetical protein
MSEQPTPATKDDLTFGGVIGHASVVVIEGTPLEATPVTKEQREAFTREHFEGALDRASRPVKGRYADILPSSEDFIKDKRREAELEDR